MLDTAPLVALVLLSAIFASGLVRGFAGFGDALIFIPIASIFISPVLAVALFMIVGVPGPMVMLPEAIKKANKTLLLYLNIPMVILLPIGFLALAYLPEEPIRAGTSGLAIFVAVLIFVGWRPRFQTKPLSFAILGSLAGLVGGATGVPGALFIFFFLNSALKASQIRANVTIILWIFDLALIAITLLSGVVAFEALGFAFVLIPAYMLGNLIGKKLFDPQREQFFRRIGLSSIFMSGILGLPYGVFQ